MLALPASATPPGRVEEMGPEWETCPKLVRCKSGTPRLAHPHPE